VTLSKEYAYLVPCCGTGLMRIRRFTIWLWSVMLLSWLLLLLVTRFESEANALRSHMSGVLAVLCASKGWG
jgi:hypothetical protein